MRFAARPFDDELSPAPSETWWQVYDENRELPMPPQLYGWTCSICASDWLLRATGLDPYSTREKVAMELGPSCVDPYSGLKDTQCLVRLLESFGVPAAQEWVGWDRALELAASTAVIWNSTSWYHFVGGRGLVDGDLIWIANSAEGYKGIYDSINRQQFQQWEGSWQAVYLVR